MQNELERYGKALIVDGHSFPSQSLPYDQDQSVPRPEFCIGTDPFHTPVALSQATARSIKKMGHSVGMNWPYAGTIVPKVLYQQDRRVASIMIEVNRSLYMDELTGTRTGRFGIMKEQIQTILDSIRQLHEQA